MKRLDLPYVRTRKGGRYWYFIKGGVNHGRLPPPNSPDFLSVYNRYLHGQHVKPAKMSFAKLIDIYKTSPEYARLAAGTRKQYDRHLLWLKDVLGPRQVAKFRPYQGHEMLTQNAHKPNVANARLDVLRNLMRHAISIGWRDDNPLREIRRLPVQHKHAKAWPKGVQDAFRAQATGTTLLYFELALWTGQRIGDVLRFKWSDIDDGAIRVVQQKTKAELWLPLSDRLQRILAQVPKTGIYIIDENGPVTVNAMSKRVQKLAPGYTAHGLRATAAQELAAAGASDELIMALTGHTRSGSIAGYTGQERQKKRAVDAMKLRGGG